MQLNRFDYVLWAASFFGHILLLLILLRRRSPSRVPTFTGLIAFLIVKAISLYTVNRYCGSFTYFYVYWILALVEAILELAVLAEVTLKVFRPLGRLVPDVKRPVMAVMAIGVFMALLLSVLAAAPNTSAIGIFVSRAELFAYALLSEFLVGFLYIAQTSGFGWSRQTSRVLLGLGVYAFASFLASGLQNYFGRSEVYRLLSWAQIVAYIGSLTYWIVAFSRKPEPVTPIPTEVIERLEKLSANWALVLKAFETRGVHE